MAQSQPSWAVFQGFLWKQGGIVHSWKKRFFVLFDDGRLAYFASRESAPASAPHFDYGNTAEGVKISHSVPKALGVVSVRQCERLTACGIDESEFVQGTVRGFEMELAVPGRVYRLLASSEKERREWMDALRSILLEESSGGVRSGDRSGARSTANGNGDVGDGSFAGFGPDGEPVRAAPTLAETDPAAAALTELLHSKRDRSHSSSSGTEVPVAPKHLPPAARATRLTVLRPAWRIYAERSMQESALLRWADHVLIESAANGDSEASGLRARSLEDDFSDGEIFVRLVQVLMEDARGLAILHRPTHPAHKMMNVNTALKYLREKYHEYQSREKARGLPEFLAPDFPIIPSEGILNGQAKTIADALWACTFVCVICPCQFCGQNGEEAIRAWLATRAIPGLPSSVRFDAEADSWPRIVTSGYVLCSLLDSYEALPEGMRLEDLRIYDQLRNLQLALQVARGRYNIPPILQADEVHSLGTESDEGACLLFVALCFRAFE